MDILRNESAATQPHAPVLVVHGGAWAIPDDVVEAHQNGVRNAMAAGWRALMKGATGVDAVEEAVVVMEDDDTFDAGRGAFLNRDGKVQLDALIMDGATLRAGGVGCVERIRNAVRAARKVLEESPHCYFVGEGAERFAAEHGIPLIDNSELVVERERKRLEDVRQHGMRDEFVGAAQTDHDTVGAIALDQHGRLAAATSTGGTLNKAPGRVGDSSLIGCGCYADDVAAVSTTGWGEPMMKLVLGKWAVDRVEQGRSPESVAFDAMAYLKARADGHGGIILLDRNGRIGIAHNTPRMAFAYKTSSGEMSGIHLPTA
jgi:L-asparaginase / beta-aspartyl-peptidase